MSNDTLVGNKQYHYAIVTKIGDALLRGAVFFKSDTLTNGTEFPDPAEPSFPLAGQKGEGFFWVPQVGDQIEVEIDMADEHPVPKYVRMLYSSEDDIPEEFKTNYGFRMGWRTRGGHILLFDNKPEALMVQFLHKIGTGFTWDKDGNEIKNIVKNLVETIKGEVIREVTAKVTETFKAEVTRNYGAKLTENVKGDMTQNVTGAATIKSKAKGIFAGKAGTDVGDTASVTNVNGSMVNVAGGGAPIAYLGAQAVGIGNLGAPVVSTIVSGSSKATVAP